MIPDLRTEQLDDRLAWSEIGKWLAAIALLEAGSGFRLFWDALMCGDDGAADDGDRDAIDYCGFLDDRLNVFDVVSPVFDFGPPSIYFLAFVTAVATAIGALGLRAGVRSNPAPALTAGIAAVVLIAIAGTSASPGFFAWYVLPLVVAVGGTFVARVIGASVRTPVVAGAVISLLFFLPSLYVSL